MKFNFAATIMTTGIIFHGYFNQVNEVIKEFLLVYFAWRFLTILFASFLIDSSITVFGPKQKQKLGKSEQVKK